MESYSKLIASTLQISLQSVKNTLELLSEGSTIPFIARYRKESTGSLDEVEIADIQREWKRLEELDKRKEAILKSIEEQGKLTDELRAKIKATLQLNDLEDLYLPFKRKKKTKAGVAREHGLEPLALSIYSQENDINPVELASQFINEQVADVEAALQGARDIIAEIVSEDINSRNLMRKIYNETAVVQAKVVKGKEEEGIKYKDYYEFSEPLSKCPSHRILAIRRAEEEGILRVMIAPTDEEMAIFELEKVHVKKNNPSANEVKVAVKDSYERLLSPSIETEFRQISKEKADLAAIDVFSDNLRQLLLSAPLGQKVVLGIDPGFRTGCKIVVLNASGELLENTTIFPHPPQNDTSGAVKTMVHLIQKHHVEAIGIGNGTAGRESMDFCRTIPQPHPISIFSVNEAGASIYSASEAAREEFPEQDLTVRGAISIGRRLMDPLAELVKIDPKSIGVGQYQHDVNQPKLKESLDTVVGSCVNSVGVNLNTASKHLLAYISGLGPALAQNIVKYRTENGPFKARKELKKVPRMGEKAYEQSAGFLRIRNGEHPLDNTAVHPESYSIVEKMAKDLGCSIDELIKQSNIRKQIKLNQYVTEKVGLPTLNDILKELNKPGLDPRGEAKAFSFADGIHTIDDLRTDMVLQGIVNNITNFGAFVDIGIKESGLVHVSQMANRFIKSPSEVVKLNQEVTVRIVEIDYARKRVQLSMKDVN
ncbi:MAG: hypothetical protein RLZZ417_2032 [Bacteroidota bacterium]|jgi:uncharacterized protein